MTDFSGAVREALAATWRREIAFQRERVMIPVWRVGLGVALGGVAGQADSGWGYWIALVCSFAVTLGPWAWAKSRAGGLS